MDEAEQVIQAQRESPNGNLTGLSAMLNHLSPAQMNVVLGVVGAAVLVEMFPEGLPAVVLLVAAKITKIAVVLGIASSGVRK